MALPFLDGSNNGADPTGASPQTITLTTVYANDLIFACYGCGPDGDNPETPTSSPSITWTALASAQATNPQVAVYYGTWSGSGAIAITFSKAADNHSWGFWAFAVSNGTGIDADSPFSAHADTNTVPTVTGVSSASANALFFGVAAWANTGHAALGPGTLGPAAATENNLGWANTGHDNTYGVEVQQLSATSTVSSQTMNFGGSNTGWAMVVFAVAGSGSVPSTIGPDPNAAAIISVGGLTGSTPSLAGVSTSYGPDLIYIQVMTANNSPNGYVTVSNVTVGGSPASFRAFSESQTSVDFAYERQETWTYVASSPLSNVTVAVTLSGSPFYGAAIAVLSITNANTGSPFDPNAAVPATAALTMANSNPATVNISTSNANDMIIGAFPANNPITPGTINGTNALVAATGYDNTTGVGYLIEYLVVSSTLASAALTSTQSPASNWSVIADAVQQASAAPAGSLSLPLHVSRNYRHHK